MLKNYITVVSSFKMFLLVEYLTADITCRTAVEMRFLGRIERKTARERRTQKIKWNVKINTEMVKGEIVPVHN
jgi:hypothetical protein